jgi:hypothetical protein
MALRILGSAFALSLALGAGAADAQQTTLRIFTG